MDADLAAFEGSLPHTRLGLDVDVRPQGDGIGGAFSATNGEPGTYAEQRLPITGAAGHYRFTSDSLGLSELQIDFPGGGRASGEATINVAAQGAPSRWRLDVRDLDLAQLHPRLSKTRLRGSLKADIDGARQIVEGDVAEASLAIAFAATYAERRLDVTRFRARAAGGTLAGTGRLVFDASRAFEVALTAEHFDPAKFVALKSGVLDGTIRAHGTLVPEWKTSADITLAKGSRYAGVAVSGFVRGTFTRHTAAQASLDVSAAGAHLTAKLPAANPPDKR